MKNGDKVTTSQIKNLEHDIPTTCYSQVGATLAYLSQTHVMQKIIDLIQDDKLAFL